MNNVTFMTKVLCAGNELIDCLTVRVNFSDAKWVLAHCYNPTRIRSSTKARITLAHTLLFCSSSMKHIRQACSAIKSLEKPSFRSLQKIFNVYGYILNSRAAFRR